MTRLDALRGLIRPATAWPLFCFLYFLLSYRSLAYFAGGLGVLAGYWLLLASWGRAGRSLLGLSVLALLGMALPALGMWQALQLQDLGDLDHADYVCAFWNLMRGETRYSINDLDIFGSHSNYTCVFWIPLQMLGGEYALKAGKAFCLLAAVALAFRRHWPDRHAASWGAAALLLSPPVASQFFFGFHPEFLAAPLLVLAFEAYREERLARFLVLTGLLAYSKEVFTLAIGGILLVALVERRPWKWWLLPGLLCLVQMAVYWFVVVPRFTPEANHLTSTYLPTSLGQVIDGWFRMKSLQYVLHATFPFVPLMLAMPRRYLLLPLPLMAFYAGFPDTLFMEMWPNYAFPLAFLCAAGLVLAKNLRIDSVPARPAAGESSAPSAPVALDGRILLACAVLSLLSYPLWREVLSVPRGNLDRGRVVDGFRARIPDQASVLVHGPIAVRFAARKEVQTWGFRKRPMEDFDYVVIEASLPYWVKREDELARDIGRLSRSPEWIREYGKDSLFLFRRNRGPAAGPAPGP